MSPTETEHAIQKITSHGRLTTALDFSAMHSHSPNCPISIGLMVELLEMAIDDKNAENVQWQHLTYDIPQLLKVVEASNQIDSNRLAKMEWYLLPLLAHSQYQPRAITRALADDPTLFIGLMKWAFKSNKEQEHELTEYDMLMVSRSHDLLRLWQTLPGSNNIQEDNITRVEIDVEKLLTWIQQVRKLAGECDRLEICDEQIGQMLSHSPQGSDKLWPHEAVRTAFEHFASSHIEIGFEVGLFNSRGVTSRGLTEGGEQERLIANQYRDYGEHMRGRWPRTSRLMGRLADRYESYARREDVEAELTQDLWR